MRAAHSEDGSVDGLNVRQVAGSFGDVINTERPSAIVGGDKVFTYKEMGETRSVRNGRKKKEGWNEEKKSTDLV